MVFEKASVCHTTLQLKVFSKILLAFAAIFVCLSIVGVTMVLQEVPLKETILIKLYTPGSKYDQPNHNRIYFHETTGRSRLNIRQTCAIEAAAKNNPNKPVQLFMLHTPDFDFSSPWLKVLASYNNIEIILLKEEDYFKDTPLSEWMKKGEWRLSQFKVAHLADYLRMVSALKGGGLYLDMDILTLKSYDEITRKNFFVVEDSKANIICNSVFYLNNTHRFVNKIVNQLVEDYDPTAWAYHGSDIIIAIMEEHCGFKKSKLPITNECNDINLLDYETFFALVPEEFYLMFKPATNYSLSLFDKSFGVHIWNSKTRHDFLDLRTNQLYSVLARNHCPMTLEQATYCHPT